MRGATKREDWMFRYISVKNWVPTDHLLRPIDTRVDAVHKDLSLMFENHSAKIGCPVVQSRTAQIRAAQDRAARIRAAQVRAAQLRPAHVPSPSFEDTSTFSP
jgi:O-acetylhomoserine/O-acetylserine sulfhydrylase-like pyridoxal-dependent enzyme